MLFSENGFESFLAVARTVGNQLAEDLENGIVGDAIILRECFDAAQHSIKFHGKGESASHIKQAAHCCFWLSKLKPLKFSTGFVEFTKHFVHGDELARFSHVFSTKKSPKEAAAYPINEAFALAFGHKVVVDGLELLANKASEKGEHAQCDEIRQDIAYNDAKLEKVFLRLMKSLRLNNHSARGLAAMFEWVYFNGFE